MRYLRVAEARARFGEVLDNAENGTPVVIERRGVRFRVVAEPAPSSAAHPRDKLFEFVDPVIRAGQWTWKKGRKGLLFSARPRQR